MEFYRLFHGLPYDARLAVIAKRSGLTRAETLALFIALHDHASQCAPRGTLKGFDAEQAALGLDLDPPKVSAALEAFADKGIIRDEFFSEWARQISPSTERVRRHRARKRANGQLLPKRPPATGMLSMAARPSTAPPRPPSTDPDDPREAALRRQRIQQARHPSPQKERP